MLVVAETELSKTFCCLRDFLLSETIAPFAAYIIERKMFRFNAKNDK